MQGFLIGPLTKRFGEERLMLSGLALITLGLLLLPLARAVPMLLAAASALSLGMGAMQPSLNSLISRRAGVGQQGEAMGVAQSAAALSRGRWPFVRGSVSPAFC